MTLSVIFYPYHFVRAILSIPFCPMPFCPYTILSIPFCPYHFVRYHFVLEPYILICICINSYKVKYYLCTMRFTIQYHLRPRPHPFNLPVSDNRNFLSRLMFLGKY